VVLRSSIQGTTNNYVFNLWRPEGISWRFSSLYMHSTLREDPHRGS
jgi:hypothetical protein